MKMDFIFFIFLFSVESQAWVTDVVSANQKGVEFLKKQNFTKAQDQFSKGLSEAPYAAELQLNLGLSFDGAGQPEKALQSYEQTVQLTKDETLLFASYFNQAEIYGRQKKVTEALAFYQKALEHNPDSIEAKTNIELLTQQQQGGGQGQDQNKDKDKDKGKDKDKDKDKDKQDQKDSKGDQDKDQEKDYGGKNKPQPKKFQSEELTPGDAKKILEELDRQEQRVRAEYNKKQRKERPNGKDW